MSKRGIKFQFRSGESVLCFEPDASKAKVLYDAKILDVSVTQDKIGKRRPAYLIHFLRWNSSWDRVVPESYLLKNTDENQALMRKLAVVSQKIKRNKTRMKKIDCVLKHHFQKLADPHKPVEVLESDIEDNSSTKDDDDDGTSDSSSKVTDSDSDAKVEDDESDKEESEAEDETKSTDTEDETSQPREPIKLEIPHALKKILSHDQYLIRTRNNLIKLPATQNIIKVLEDYVKYYSDNAVVALADKQMRALRNIDDGNTLAPENNIQLCKEVVDGLRIIFDFTLPLVLLYDCEREQYNNLLQRQLRQPLPSSPSKMVVDGKMASRSASPRGSSEYQYMEMKSEDETEIVFKSDSIKKQSKSSSPRQRRRTKTTDTSTSAESCPKRLRRSSRELSRHGDKDVHFAETITVTPFFKTEVGSPPSSCASSPERPPPKLTCSTARQQESAWKLVPDELYYQVPAPASLIYGSHHLLRLFVRLPGVLDKMFIPQRKLPHLVRHLELFIQYLLDHRDKLFPESAYSGDA